MNIKMAVYFLSGTMQVKRQRHNIFKILKEKNQTVILYPAKIPFKNDKIKKELHF